MRGGDRATDLGVAGARGPVEAHHRTRVDAQERPASDALATAQIHGDGLVSKVSVQVGPSVRSTSEGLNRPGSFCR